MYISLSQLSVINLPTIAMAIVVDLKGDRDKFSFTLLQRLLEQQILKFNSFKRDNLKGSNTEKMPWTNVQNRYKKRKQRGSERQHLLLQSWKSDNYI